MYTIRQLIKNATDYLEKRGIVSPQREAEELLGALLQKKRGELYLEETLPIGEKDVACYLEWVRLRGEKTPFAYIVGEVEFLHLKLKVTPATLIPRHETEILADLIIKSLPEEPLEVWDVCTGTGCLGLAVKKGKPKCEVTLSDLSKEALAVAQINAEKNGLKVSLLEGDLLSPFRGKRADVVMCNPPYVALEDYEFLEEEVCLFEPKEALLGGLDFYRRLARDLPCFLHPKGKVFLEIGAGQGDDLMRIFSESHWVQKKCKKDWSGQDRFFFLEYDKTFQ